MITPGSGPQPGEEEAFYGPGEYFKEIMQPTTMRRTRRAVGQMLEDLYRFDPGHGELPPQLRTFAKILMRRAKICGNVVNLHAAVSVAAALHLDEALDPFSDNSSMSEVQIMALAKEVETEVARLCAPGGEPVAVMRSIQIGKTNHDTCNELFRECFFDVSQTDFKAPFFDICTAMVEEESHGVLKQMNEDLAKAILFHEPKLLPSQTWHVTVGSAQLVTLQGRTGEPVQGALRTHVFMSEVDAVFVMYIVINKIRRKATPVAPRGAS